MHAKLLSCVWLCVTLCTHQAPLSMGFCTQEYCSGLPCNPQEDLPDPGIEPTALMSPALAGRFLPLVPSGKPEKLHTHTHTHTHTHISLFMQHVYWVAINPEYSLEGLMLKLKLQHFGHQMWRADSLEKLWCWERLRARGEGGDKGWDGWMASLTQRTWVWVSPGDSEGQGSLACCSSWACKESDTT